MVIISVTRICVNKLIRVDSYKYLGDIFDKRIKWTEHFKYVKHKTGELMYVVKQVGDIFNFNELKLAYFAYFQSLFMGDILHWRDAFKTIFQPLNIILSPY